MNIEQLRLYCLSKEYATEDLPFGPNTLVFRVGGKMFGLMPLDEEEGKINLKAEPSYAEELREQYEGIIPGYQMNKKHWNTVFIERDVPTKTVLMLVDISYNLVLKSLTKKQLSSLYE